MPQEGKFTLLDGFDSIFEELSRMKKKRKKFLEYFLGVKYHTRVIDLVPLLLNASCNSAKANKRAGNQSKL